MSISHIHVLLSSFTISLIVSLTLPSWSPVLVLKLPDDDGDGVDDDRFLLPLLAVFRKGLTEPSLENLMKNLKSYIDSRRGKNVDILITTGEVRQQIAARKTRAFLSGKI